MQSVAMFVLACRNRNVGLVLSCFEVKNEGICQDRLGRNTREASKK
eukprot:COSAG06_NODE_40184_length_404_cov_1.072131_1_plen_45_part_01